MRRRVNLDVRPEQCAISDLDLGDIQHDAIEVKEHAVSEEDVAAIIAIKRRFDPGANAMRAEQFMQDAFPEFGFVVAGVVELFEQQAAASAFGGELGSRAL